MKQQPNLVDKLALRFADGGNAGKVCPADEWIGFYEHTLKRSLGGVD